MIIEAWLFVFGGKYSLKYKTYTFAKGEVNVISALTNEKNDSIPILVGKQGKDEYLNFLSSLIDIPKIIQDSNNVTLKENYDLSKMTNNNKN